MLSDEYLRERALETAQRYIKGYTPSAPLLERTTLAGPIARYLLGQLWDPDLVIPGERERRDAALRQVQRDLDLLPRDQRRLSPEHLVRRCHRMEVYLWSG